MMALSPKEATEFLKAAAARFPSLPQLFAHSKSTAGNKRKSD
jgi:hypothetical protein